MLVNNTDRKRQAKPPLGTMRMRSLLASNAKAWKVTMFRSHGSTSTELNRSPKCRVGKGPNRFQLVTCWRCMLARFNSIHLCHLEHQTSATSARDPDVPAGSRPPVPRAAPGASRPAERRPHRSTWPPNPPESKVARRTAYQDPQELGGRHGHPESQLLFGAIYIDTPNESGSGIGPDEKEHTVLIMRRIMQNPVFWSRDGW